MKPWDLNWKFSSLNDMVPNPQECSIAAESSSLSSKV